MGSIDPRCGRRGVLARVASRQQHDQHPQHPDVGKTVVASSSSAQWQAQDVSRRAEHPWRWRVFQLVLARGPAPRYCLKRHSPRLYIALPADLALCWCNFLSRSTLRAICSIIPPCTMQYSSPLPSSTRQLNPLATGNELRWGCDVFPFRDR